MTRDRECLVEGKTVGLTVFCDKAPRTLARTLASYERSGLLRFFDDVCVFFIGGHNGDSAVASKYGLRSFMIDDGLGFGGALKKAVDVMDADYVLMVDHDRAVWGGSTVETLREQLTEAMGVLVRDAADVVRLRHSWMGKSPVSAAAVYSYFYPVDQLSSRWKHAENLSDAPSWMKFFRRLMNPLRAKRWIGRSVYVEENPHLKFPSYIHKDGNLFIVDSAVFHWSNQPSLVSMGFLKKQIMGATEHSLFSQCVTGSDLERLVNSRKWRNAHHRIGVAPGIFL